MQFTIEGLSQEQLVLLKLDAIDAVIIRWFATFYLGNGMKKTEKEGKLFGWVKYSQLIEELPCIGIKNPEVLARRFGKYTACGLMERIVVKVRAGTHSCFSLNPAKWDALTRKATPDSKVVCEPTPDSKVGWAPDSKVVSDSYINDSKTGKRVSKTPPPAKDEKKPVKPREPPAEQSRLTTLFFALYQGRVKGKPSWTGKEGDLLRRDIARLGAARLESAMRTFFGASPPAGVKKTIEKMGFGYSRGFRCSLDALQLVPMKEPRRQLGRTCSHCGTPDASTSAECLNCHRPFTEEVRRAAS